MARSTDPGHFFQTSSALDNSARKAEKSKNKNGDPIKLPSKILAVIEDPESNAEDPAVFVAEAAGCVKRVSLQSKEITHTFRPNTSTPAPLTCLAITPRSRDPNGTWTRTLLSGSWDKVIYSWALSCSPTGIQTTPPSHRYTGHTDFIKTVLVAPFKDTTYLISASADSTIIIWSLATGAKLHVLQGHSRGVQALALDPFPCDPSEIGETEEESMEFFTGDSNREIRRWLLTASTAHELPTAKSERGLTSPPFQPLVVHETSIFALTFSHSGDLWTASADRTAKSLGRERDWAVDTVLRHPDYVKAIAVDERGEYVVTGCRDEEVRVWDGATGECVCLHEGHFEEVTGLCIVGREVVSVSIDGTIRRWGLREEDFRKAKEVAERGGAVGEAEKPKESMLTEEEERELAELMDESE